MRWLDIINENDLTNDLRQIILTIFKTYESMGVYQISVQQLVDQIKSNNEFSSINIDQETIMRSLNDIDSVSVQTNDNGISTLVFGKKITRSGNDSEEDQKNINAAAQRTIDKELQ